MSATRLEHLYARAPVWAQHGMVTAYGVYWHRLRFGSGYAQCVREYQQRESFNATEWRDWQRARVTALLHAAARWIDESGRDLAPVVPADVTASGVSSGTGRVACSLSAETATTVSSIAASLVPSG